MRQPIATRCESVRSRSICFASTWLPTRTSRPTATLARRSSATSSSIGMRTGAASEPAIWDRVETIPREELEALQLERFRATVGRVLRGQALGAERLAAAGIASPEDVRSLEDLRAIPFAVKADLRTHYPFGLLAVPREELIRVHASSGTHGKPT